MGDRPTQMFLLVILIFLAIVESLPLSDREDDFLSERGNANSKWKNTERGLVMEFPNHREKGTALSSEIAQFARDFDIPVKTAEEKFAEQVQERETDLENIESKLFEMDETEGDILYNAEAPSEDSSYLQSDVYNQRSKRQKRFSGWGLDAFPVDEPSEDFNNKHVVPCNWLDRLYCHNGGRCVYVVALYLKTCRCPKAYTGSRCEMIDPQYLMSQFTNNNAFSFDFGWER